MATLLILKGIVNYYSRAPKLLLMGLLLISNTSCGREWGTINFFGSSPGNGSFLSPGSAGPINPTELGQSLTNTYGKGTFIDSSGNLYLTGYTNGTLGTQYGVHGQDLFVAKFSPLGNPIWISQVGCGGSVQGVSIVVDGSGNSYVGGSTLCNPLGLQYHIHGTSGDAVIVKFDPNGVYLAAGQIGGGGASSASAATIALDSSGNVYITGQTSATLGGTNYGVAGTTNLFVLKVASDLSATVWERNLGAGGATVVGYGLAFDSSGNMYTSGYTTSVLVSSTTYGILDFTGSLLTKFNSSGIYQWSRILGGGTFNSATGLTIDGSNNLYFTGSVTSGSVGGTQYGVNGNTDLFVAKYDSGGNYQWANQFGAAGANAAGYNIAYDGANGLFISGGTNTYMGGVQYGTLGASDALIVNFDLAGNFYFANQFGVATATIQSFGVSCSGGKPFIGGTTNQSLGNVQIGSNGTHDGFLMGFSSAGLLQ